jgi:2-hydroxy-6-oxonona-2,4-dienedioate hydrolase
METLRRDFLKLAAAAAVPLIPLHSAEAANAPASPPGPDPLLMGEAKYIEADGYRTRYFDGGNGPPLVLVHGGQWPAIASANRWAPIFDHLAAHYHVYALDKLGMGYTAAPRTDEDFTMEAITNHIFGFINALGLERVILGGHSRGCLPIARIAAEHPERVSHLIIFDSNTLAPDDPNTPPRVDPPVIETLPSREEVLAQLMEDEHIYTKTFITDAYVDAEYEVAQNPQRRAIDQRFRAARDRWVAANPDIVAERPAFANNMGATTWWMYEMKNETLAMINAGNLKAPTLIIWGFNDPTAPYFLAVNLMETVSKVVEHTELHIVNHSGHRLAEEQPAKVAQLIDNFVKATPV